MKRLSIVLLGVVISLSVVAQTKAPVFSFLGIPIDGSKEKIYKALETKGFKELSLFDYASGMFNGEEVKVRVSTNCGVVDRIQVEYPYCSAENDARVKYNVLLSRFNRNAKYICIIPREEIPTDESISRRLQENSKFYDSIYFYLSPGVDAKQWEATFKMEYRKQYGKSLQNISYEEMEEALFCLPSSVSSTVSGIVWFTMADSHTININYINFKNRPRGEDL